VFVDRSRDGVDSGALLRLHPLPQFAITENERRLTPARLARCDVLVIQLQGASRYTARECSAVREFVRAGGGLLLTTCAGAFERDTGRGIERSTAQQVADLFGVRFLSPDAAQARVRFDRSLASGFPRGALALSGRGPLKTLGLGDLTLTRSAPLELPRGARVLLRHRRSGEAVAATVRAGRGRVVVANASGFGCPAESVGVSVLRWLAGRRSGVSSARLLPDVLAVSRKEVRRGDVRVRVRSVGRRRAERLVDQAEELTEKLRGLSGRQNDAWLLDLVPGTGCRFEREWSARRTTIRLGADARGPGLVYGLANALCRQLFWQNSLCSVMWRSIDPETLGRHLALRMLAESGYAGQAAAWREILEAWPDGSGDPRAIDLGRWRHETGPSPAMWIWRALEEECGREVIDRFLRCAPRKFPWERFRHWDVFTEFDILVYYLSRAARRDLFGWFAERGCTVHPLPLIPTDDSAFDRRCLAAIRRQFRDTEQPVSGRFDAARALVRSRIRKCVSLGREAISLGSKDEGRRLVAAMRLARARDERGWAELGRIARGASDSVHAAMAAITLVEAGETRAAGRLVELAGTAEPRFQLDARAALRPLGRDIEAPLRIIVRRQEPGETERSLAYLAEIDGYLGANVFSGLQVEHWPHGLVVPHVYVQWVHTAPKWRRKGLSRELFFRTLSDRWLTEAPTAGLDTGTTNVAHRIYRSGGFIDTWRWENWRRELKSRVPVPRVQGVRIRRGEGEDVGRITRLYNEVYADYMGVPARRAEPLASESWLITAEREGKLVAYVLGRLEERDGRGRAKAALDELCVRPGEEAERVMQAVGAKCCSEAARRGATVVHTWRVPEDGAVRRGLMAAGFTHKEEGGVQLWRVNDLAALLEGLKPLLERRLRAQKRHDWCGSIGLRAKRLVAGLEVDRGRVQALGKPPRAPDVAVETDADTLSRVMVGRATMFEAMLQMRLRIRPRPNRDVTTLLGALFPRMKMYPG
jgi:hypothetical protein